MNTPDLIHELLKKESNRKLALQEDLILEVTNRICELMDSKNVSKADLAKSLHTSRAYVTGLLSGDRNMTLRTLSDVYYALGRKATITDVMLGSVNLESTCQIKMVYLPSWNTGQLFRFKIEETPVAPPYLIQEKVAC